MDRASLKESIVTVEVVGEISLLNNGKTEKMWKVTSEDGVVTYIPDSVFVERYSLIDKQEKAITEVLAELDTVKQELSLKNEMLRNIQVEYLNSLTKNEYMEKNYTKLQSLAKETFMSLESDIKEINSRTNAEIAALTNTISNIVKTIA